MFSRCSSSSGTWTSSGDFSTIVKSDIRYFEEFGSLGYKISKKNQPAFHLLTTRMTGGLLFVSSRSPCRLVLGNAFSIYQQALLMRSARLSFQAVFTQKYETNCSTKMQTNKVQLYSIATNTNGLLRAFWRQSIALQLNSFFVMGLISNMRLSVTT